MCSSEKVFLPCLDMDILETLSSINNSGWKLTYPGSFRSACAVQL